MKKIIIIVTLINLASKILGFGREISLSYFFGATYITDAYLVAVSVPTVVFGLIGSGVLHSFIPVYTGIEKRDGEVKAFDFTNNFFNVMLIFSFIVMLIGIFCAPIIAKVFSFGFDQRTFDLTVYFIRIMIVSIFFIVATNVFSGLLQLNHEFIIVALSGIPFNITYIVGNYFSFKYNYHLLGVFSNIALFLQFLILVPSLRKISYRYKFNVNFKDKYIREIMMLGVPVIIGNSIEKINIIIDRSLASRLAEGAISVLNYASILNSALFFLSIYSGLNLLFPDLARLGAERDIKGLNEKFRYISNIIFIFCIPVTVGIILLRTDLIRMFFGRGRFNENDIFLTAQSLMFYSSSFIALSFRELQTKYFYVLKNTKTPVINSVVGICLNIILNLTLPKYFGISGIALATSISLFFITLLLGISLKKYYSINFTSNNFFVFLKVLACSSFMIFVIKLLGNWNLFFRIFVGAVSYIVFILFMKINEVEEIKKSVVDRIKLLIKGKRNG